MVERLDEYLEDVRWLWALRVGSCWAWGCGGVSAGLLRILGGRACGRRCGCGHCDCGTTSARPCGALAAGVCWRRLVLPTEAAVLRLFATSQLLCLSLCGALFLRWRAGPLALPAVLLSWRLWVGGPWPGERCCDCCWLLRRICFLLRRSLFHGLAHRRRHLLARRHLLVRRLGCGGL